MKRLTVLALALAVLAGWGATQAFGVAQLYLAPSSMTVNAKTAFTETLNIRNNSNCITAWQAAFYYDTTLITFTGSSEGTFLKQNGSTFFQGFARYSGGPGTGRKSGLIMGGCTMIGSGYASQATGTLALLTFKSDSTPGTHRDTIFFDTLTTDDNTFLLDTTGFEIPGIRTNTLNSVVIVVGPSGVEGMGGCRQKAVDSIKSTPNPFTSFTTVPGHSSDYFTLYDVSGRKVGTYLGNRIGESLAPGVYFLKSEGKDCQPLRVIKLR